MKSLFRRIRRSIQRRLRPQPFVAQRILLTGAAGSIGQAACDELVGRGHWVRAMDLAPAPASAPAHEWIQGDIGTPDLLDAAMDGIDTVVHLAGVLETRPFEPDLIETNIRSAYRIFESARHHGVRRMVLASSVQSVFWHTVGRRRPVRADSSYAPIDTYAVTKIFAEQLGWVYAQQHGMSTIAIRYGWLPHNAENRQKLDNSPDYHDWYLSPGDAARGTTAAVEAPDWRIGKFRVVYILSRPRGAGPFDLRPARKLLGYVPRDQYAPPA